MSLCPFYFGHCVVCPSIYGFWLPRWYLQTFFLQYVLSYCAIFFARFIVIQRLMIIAGTIYLLRCLCVMSTAIPMPQKTYDCTRLVCIIFREQSTSYGVSVLCLRQYQCLRRRMTVHVWYVLCFGNNPPLTVSLCYVYGNTNASEDVWLYTFGMYYISGTIHLLPCFCVIFTAILMPQKKYTLGMYYYEEVPFRKISILYNL